jgi:hypothetical protein
MYGSAAFVDADTQSGLVAGDRVDDQDLGECGFDDEPR